MWRVRVGAVAAVALSGVAVGGLIVAHDQHQVAQRTTVETDRLLDANAKALDVLLGANAGVRAYVASGDLRSMAPYQSAKGRLMLTTATIGAVAPASAEQAFVADAERYLTTDALSMIALRMMPLPPLAHRRVLADDAQLVQALRSENSRVRSVRVDEGRRTVTAARASARTAQQVAIGAGSAGAILLAALLFTAMRRPARLRDVELPSALAGALTALTASVASTKAYTDSQEHDDRVGRIAAQIAAAMGLSTGMQDLLLQAAPLHDVGNVAVPDHILLKPGVLTTDERAVMEQHTTTGAEILAESESAVLKMAQAIARDHHERWDGLGYPQGLAGTDIALPARIVAVADVFDALTHVRPHRQGSTISEAVAYIVGERGAQFDPTVVDAFLKIDHRGIDAVERSEQVELHTVT